MGAQLAMSVYTYWSELPHPPFRLLVRMAITAKDSDPEPKAWLGREELARAMGLEPTAGNLSTIRRWLRVLKDAGAIECTEIGRFGRRTTYRIHPRPQIERVEKPVDKIIRRAMQEVRTAPPQEVRTAPPQEVRTAPPQEVRTAPPEETFQETVKEHRKENHVASTYSR